jgi:predicted GIY-YIG superfamily endonuclease
MELCYLLAFPDADDGKAPTREQIMGLKDAPYFQPIDLDLVSLGEETVLIEGHAVQVIRQRYDGCVQMVECRFGLADPFDPSVLQERAKIESALQSKFIPTQYRENGLYEEYTILLVKDAKPSPDKWIEKNALALAKLIRSQREVFDKSEIDEILMSRTRYSTKELTLVDWDGAVIIAPHEDYQSDIALLKIGNYQLLHYRMLDESIDGMLDKINETFFTGKRRPRPTRGVIRQIAEHKLEVMVDFERVEQNLLLIGDWYTAKLYEAIQNEFYLKDWKESVKNKLDNLESIVETIKDNFSLSLESVWARVEMLAWALMLLGYLYLTFVDLGLLKK